MRRRAPQSRRRGQAAVEMAVTMIVVLPLIFYTLFLEDLLVYNLEWQEAIVVSPWDALPLNYAKGNPDPAGNPQRYNRKVYCDHTAAYDSFQKGYDCSDQVHHVAMTAHQCWLVKGGKQVECTLDKSIGLDVEKVYGNDFNQGGFVSCTARLGVMNYFIPQKIFNKFGDGKNKATTTTRYTGDATQNAHPNSKVSSTANAWVFGLQGGGSGEAGDDEEGGDGPVEATTGDKGPNDDFFGVVHDPWAANTVPTVEPADHPGDHEIYRGMARYYGNKVSGGTNNAAFQGMNFGRELAGSSKKLMGMQALKEESMGDDLTQPNMAFKETDNSRKTNGKYSAGYSDSREPDTYGQRADDYMGMDKSEW